MQRLNVAVPACPWRPAFANLALAQYSECGSSYRRKRWLELCGVGAAAAMLSLCEVELCSVCASPPCGRGCTPHLTSRHNSLSNGAQFLCVSSHSHSTTLQSNFCCCNPASHQICLSSQSQPVLRATATAARQ